MLIYLALGEEVSNVNEMKVRRREENAGVKLFYAQLFHALKAEDNLRSDLLLLT